MTTDTDRKSKPGRECQTKMAEPDGLGAETGYFTTIWFSARVARIASAKSLRI